MSWIRRHVTYANVLSTLCLFLVLGGGAYAAFHLPRNSVRSKNIVNGQVKGRDLGVGAKFKSAGLPSSCSSPSTWKNIDPAQETSASFARDAFGFVHVRGDVYPCSGAGDTIFRLPPGFRPAKDETFVGGTPNGPDQVGVFHNGAVQSAAAGAQQIDGISFRCAPSGKNGCP